MHPLIAGAGGFLCLIAVGMGAYTSHSSGVDLDMLNSLEVAVRYQFWHGLSLLMIAAMPFRERWRLSIGALMFCSTLLFSGSIYGLTLAQWRAIWWVTPVGGMGLMLGWSLFIVGCWKGRRS